MPELPTGESAGDDLGSPSSRTAREQFGYVLSLPERAVRTGTGLLGGVLRESASLLVPQSFQSSRTYTVMVRQMLDFLVHDVGGVAPGAQPSSTAEVDSYVARKVVGNFVDMAALATLHLSPMMLLAAVSDVAYGSQVYLKELADELKSQGIIDEHSTIDHVNDLLQAVSGASAATGEVFNTPPLSVDALRQTIDETRAAIAATNPAHIVPQAEVHRLWEEMREIARRERVGMLAVSGAATMHSLGKIATVGRGALSTVKVAGTLFDRHVIDYYSQALREIRQKGLYASLAETSEPYIAAVWENFRANRSTVTEDLISGKLLGSTWRAARRWLGSEGQRPQNDTSAPETP
ncbi:MAG: hypothetical protein HY288_04270 [Planctomycetia bacterium]|nr:hypothetical protein [Planctomycetia bacterium]